MKILTFGDLHFHQYHQFSKPAEFGYTVRLKEQINTCKEIARVIKEEKPDFVCCGGDIFHTWSKIDTIVLDAVVEGVHIIDEACKELGLKFHIVVGNHDQLSDNDMSSNSLRPFKYYPNIVLHENMEVDDNLNIVFIPYIIESYRVKAFLDTIQDKSKYVAIAHLDFLGARFSDSLFDQSGIDTKQFKEFKEVIGHHYHLPQKLGNNIVFPGSPQVFSFNEPNNIITRGIVTFDTETKEVKRIGLNVPKWVHIDDSMPIKETLDNLDRNAYVKLSLTSDYSLEAEGVSIETVREKFLGLEVSYDIERIRSINRKREESDIVLESEEDVLNEYIRSQSCDDAKKEKYLSVGLDILKKVKNS